MPRLGEQRSIEKTVYQNLRTMYHWGSWLNSQVYFNESGWSLVLFSPYKFPDDASSVWRHASQNWALEYHHAIQTEENILGF